MKLMLFFSVFLLSAQSFAQTETVSTQLDWHLTSNVPDQGYRVYGSLGGGGGSLIGNKSDFSGSGEEFLASFNFGRRTQRWEWDTGLGWQYLHRSRVRIRSGRLDFSPRYRVGAGWQVGPIATLNFGTDTGIDAIDRPTGLSTVYGGAKSTYDVANWGRFPVQAWAELLTALSSGRRDDFTILIGMRIGLPVFVESQTSSLVAAALPAVLVTSKASPRRDVRLVLDNEKVYFGTASTRLKPAVAEALRLAGAILATDQEAWASVEVEGHADNRGSKVLNDRLSKKRAFSVKDVLIQNGMRDEKIRVVAYGFSRPADPANGPEAWAHNRRVEMTFKDVKDPELLLNALSPLMNTSNTETF